MQPHVSAGKTGWNGLLNENSRQPGSFQRIPERIRK